MLGLAAWPFPSARPGPGRLPATQNSPDLWEYSTSLISAERGGLHDELIEITEDEANQGVEQIRAEVAGTKLLAAHQP